MLANTTIFLGKPFIGCLILSKISTLDPKMICCWDHKTKAHNHIKVADEVVPGQVIAPYTKRRIDTVLNLASCNWDCCHCDPSNQENVQPDVEDEAKVNTGVFTTNARVRPK